MKNVFIALGISTAFLLSLVYKIGLPDTYILLSIVTGLTLLLSIHKYRDREEKGMILLIGFVYFLFRMIWNIVSGFSVLSSQDPYPEYVSARFFLENGHISNIPVEGLLDNSGWPIIHLMAITISLMLKVDLLRVFVCLNSLISLGILLFAYLFLRNVANALSSGRRILLLSLVLFTIAPDSVYPGTVAVRFTYGFVFYTGFLAYLSKLYAQRQLLTDRRTMFLILFFSLILVPIHVWLPFTVMLFLLIFVPLVRLGALVTFRTKLRSKLPFIHLLPAMLLFVGLFSWFNFYAPPLVWSWTKGTYAAMIRYMRFMESPSVRNIQAGYSKASYWKLMTPEPFIYLLYLRDILILGGGAMGFIVLLYKVLWKRTALSRMQLFLLSSTSAIVLITFLFEIASLLPTRMLILIMPLVAVFAGMVYSNLTSNRRMSIRLSTFALLFLAIFASFLGPWCHTFFPVYLYDPSIKFEDVGYHDSNYHAVQPFLENFVPLSKDIFYMGDDEVLLEAMLPAEAHDRIYNFHLELVIGSRGRHIKYSSTILQKPWAKLFIFEFISLRPFQAYTDDIAKYEQTRRVMEYPELVSRFAQKGNIIFDSGNVKVYVSSPTLFMETRDESA